MTTLIVTILIGICFAWILHTREEKDERRDAGRIFPLYKLEENCILSKNGDCTLCYELTLPEVFTLSGRQFDAIHQSWVKAIKVLPKHSIIHKQDWFTRDSYKASFSKPEQGFLDRSSERFFNERPFMQHRCFLMLTKKATGRKPSSSVWNNLLRTSLVPKDNIDPKTFQDFMDAAGQFGTILADSGQLQLRRLTEDEITGLEERTGILDAYLCQQDIGEMPVAKDIQFKPDWKTGDQYNMLFSIANAEDMPARCSMDKNYDKYATEKTEFPVGFATPLGLLLECNHIYNQYILIDDLQATMKRLESKRARLQSLSAYSRENALAKDAIDDFLNEAIDKGRLPVKVHYNLHLWTDDRSELKELRNQAATALTKVNVQPRQETIGAAQLFWAGLPGNEADLPMNECFDLFAEQAVCFLNMETNYASSVAPAGIRLGDRLTGRPLNVDLSDEPMQRGIITNRNKFVLGPSGSGKSYLTNHLQRSYYEHGAHCLVVDVGHSYKGLCDLVGGYYFTYEEKSPVRFNPFYIAEGDVLDTEKKESIKTLLLALWKKDNEVFKRSEYVALSNALTAYYDYLEGHEAVFPCFNSFYEFLKEQFVFELEKDKVKDRDFDMGNFLYVLRPYYAGGEFDYLLNATENLDLLQQRFIVFELDNIKDHQILFPVVTLIIMETFISKMRKLKGIRKIILIEEAWKAIAREGMAEYIKYLFKTVRKFYGEAWVVTQEVDDIISSPIVKQAVINNADCKILLDQSKFLHRFDQIQELLGLSDKDKALVLSINKANDPTKKYKEVFIALGNDHSRVYRTEVSMEEHLTYTTEEKEKMRVQQNAVRYGSMEAGIRMLATDLKNGHPIP